MQQHNYILPLLPFTSKELVQILTVDSVCKCKSLLDLTTDNLQAMEQKNFIFKALFMWKPDSNFPAALLNKPSETMYHRVVQAFRNLMQGYILQTGEGKRVSDK